jgi:hypothetical protein
MGGTALIVIYSPLGMGRAVVLTHAAVCLSATLAPRYCTTATIVPRYQAAADIEPRYTATAFVEGC